MGRFFLRIWHKLRAEIVFGFLIGAVFWSAVLGWQAAYAPTDAEKQKCYEAAEHSSHKAEDCKTLWERTTSDPVAFFTFCLVISTIGLWSATIALYLAGEKQLAHAQAEATAADFHRTAQYEQIAEQIEVLQQSAEAAENSVHETRRLVQAAEDTAERQLRAYIGISDANITKVDTGSPEAIINMKNFGQTPAYDVRAWINIWIGEHPLTEVLPAAPQDLPKGMAVLHPGIQMAFFVPKEPPVRAQFINELGTATGTIYVYGQIKYRDAFRRERTTNFRLIYGGREPARGNLLKHDEEGNDAD